MAAARASVGVVWNHGGATARLARPAFGRVVNLPSPAGTYLAAVLDTLVADGLGAGSEIVLLHGDTGFGREVAHGTAAAAQRLGLVLHPISFPQGRGPAAFERAPEGDVLLSGGSFEDDIAIARLGFQRRWRAIGLVAAGVDEAADALGERVEGLYGPCQWMADDAPEPAEGPDADWFVGGYQHATGTTPPYPAAAAFAAGVIWQRCTRDARSTDPLPVLSAARALDTTTLFGQFRLDPLRAHHLIRKHFKGSLAELQDTLRSLADLVLDIEKHEILANLDEDEYIRHLEAMRANIAKGNRIADANKQFAESVAVHHQAPQNPREGRARPT